MKTLLCLSFFLSLTCTNSWEKNELSLSFSDSWEMKTQSLSSLIFLYEEWKIFLSLSLSHAHWFTKNKNSLLSLTCTLRFIYENSLSLSISLTSLTYTLVHGKWKLSKLFTFQDVTIKALWDFVFHLWMCWPTTSWASIWNWWPYLK